MSLTLKASLTWWDHPREYGENIVLLQNYVVPLGIIPANTGRILVDPGSTRLFRDHPREYGENIVLLQNYVVPLGIIPANTGRILVDPGSTRLFRDHPREYGENGGGPAGTQGVWGSSPRIRGECLPVSVSSRWGRIIPANTGRMFQQMDRRAFRRDHPREYGENTCGSGAHEHSGGSSPRIRGE